MVWIHEKLQIIQMYTLLILCNQVGFFHYSIVSFFSLLFSCFHSLLVHSTAIHSWNRKQNYPHHVVTLWHLPGSFCQSYFELCPYSIYYAKLCWIAYHYYLLAHKYFTLCTHVHMYTVHLNSNWSVLKVKWSKI